MADLDILAAIDAATGCQFCGGPLGESPSDDFCSPSHQRQWHDQNVEPLPWSEDAAVVYVGADHARVPLTELASASSGYARAGLRERSSRERVQRRQEFAWVVVDEANVHVECGVDGCHGLARPAWTIADSLCPDHQVAQRRAAWRLPRQTGNLRADLRACTRARTTATTDAQRAAVALRTEQLAARSREPWRQLREAFEPVLQSIVAAADRLGRDLSRAYGGSLRHHIDDRLAVDVAAVRYDRPYAAAPDRETTPRERALQARRDRNTGPPAARMDGRRGRGVRR